MSHVVEIDQSGRVEFTSHDTVLSFSDGKSFSVLIPAKVKRRCIVELRGRGLSGPTLYTQLFATGLYFLLRDHVRELSSVRIDVEYFGKDSQIREHLINLLRRRGCEIASDQIQFYPVGKKSPAHVLALETLRGNRKPNLILNGDDLLEEFGG